MKILSGMLRRDSFEDSLSNMLKIDELLEDNAEERDFLVTLSRL